LLALGKKRVFARFTTVPAKTANVVARLDRAIQYDAASRSIIDVSGILDRPVKPGDDD
jgi:hypothetical protein